MGDTIRIRMMGDFTIYINAYQADHMVNKSRKGLAMMQYLIMNRDAQVSNRRLVSTFWPDESVANPESALKTLVSRMRTLLNQVSDGLGSCIVSNRGSYCWRSLPGMIIDVYELEDAFEQISKNLENEETLESLYQKVLHLYGGDLLKDSELNEWAMPRAVTLHNQYVEAVYGYIELLKARGDDRAVIGVCRKALEVEPFEDHIHIELMSALLKTSATSEAKAQYDEVMYLHYHYLNAEPSKELKEFYRQIAEASSTIEFSLESICNDLAESANEHNAFVCDYSVFKEIYNVQMRNIERLGSTMFLVIVMVSKLNGQPMDSMKQGNIMNGLLEIMRMNLRKGDIITHFAPTMIAMMLPTVDYNTGDIVMERLKQKFYRKYPSSDVQFNYRMAPLSANMGKTQGQGRIGLGNRAPS